MFIVLFLIGPISSVILVGMKMFSTYLPVGDDPGNWLKRINAFGGNTTPLWNENLLSYPPLFHLLGVIISFIIGDSVTGLKISALIVFFLIPISTGWLIYKISNSKEAVVIGSFLASFLPMHYEMIWWGAYPNLLGFALLPFAIYSLIRALDSGTTIRNIVYMILATLLLTMTHHITSVTFAGIIGIVCIVLILIRYLSLRFLITAISSILIVVSYLAFLIKSGYLINNPTVVKADLYEKLLWSFKDQILLYIFIVSSIIGILALITSWRYSAAIILSAWIISPVLIASSQFLGVNLDVGRLMLFLGIPMVVSSSIAMPEFKKMGRIIKEKLENDDQEKYEYSIEVNIDKVIPAILLITAMFLGPVASLPTNEGAYVYYDWLSRDLGAYSIEEKSQVLDWIKANTDVEDTIVAGYHLGRWIEGYAGRRVLMDIPLSSIAVREEFYRSLTAQAVLSSNYAVANGYFLIYDQSPLAPTFAPLIYVSREWGYDPVVYLDDSFVRFKFVRDDNEWIEAPFKSWLYGLDVKETSISKTFKLYYQTIALRINKSLEIAPYSPYFTLRYEVVPTVDAKIKEVQIFFFLAWGKTIKDFKIIDNGFRLMTESSEIVVEFDKKVSHIEAGIYPEFNQHRVQITLPLKQEGDSFIITIK
ncbi:MAG: DUF6541 family protein, partial [Candidatus Bathyarchaeia archaeon]